MTTTTKRGIELLEDPALDKSTAFTEAEKEELGLVGLVPDETETEDLQLKRVMMQLGHKTTVSYPDLSAGWHDFGLEWEPTSLVWYLDGKPIWKLTQRDTIPRTEMYLLADLAVGGSFGGPPDPQTTFPSTLLFDYVRVWQHR